MVFPHHILLLPSSASLRRIVATALIALPLAVAAQAPATQQPAPAPATQPAEQPAPDQPTVSQPSIPQPPPSSGKAQVAPEPQAVAVASVAPNGAKLPVTLEILKDRLVGKEFFLRGGWLGDSLGFTERGIALGNPKTGSFTLSFVEISSVNWDAHHVEIEGTRYALRFLGSLPYETTANEVERVNITPKRPMHISIAREKLEKGIKSAHPGPPPAAAQPSPESIQPTQATQAAPASPAGNAANGEPSRSVTKTTTFSQAAQVLNDALERIFAPALDTTLRAQLPEFWQLYYQSQRTGKRFNPAGAFHASAVEQQARLLTSIAPQSNEYAQAHNIVGQALYRVVIGADGMPQTIAAERPIGFGLDENAVEAIRKSTFQPALKNGQPVAELVDLSVIFRIYSDRTSPTALVMQSADATTTHVAAFPAAVKPAMPGPFAVQQPPSAQNAVPPPDAPAAIDSPGTIDPDAQPTDQPDAQPATQPDAQPTAPPQTTPPSSVPQPAPQTAPQAVSQS